VLLEFYDVSKSISLIIEVISCSFLNIK